MPSRPNVKRLARRKGLEGLLGALRYYDWALLRDGSYVDLGIAVRIDAVQAIAASDDQRGVDALARALGDGAPPVRLAAVNALRDRRERKALRALLNAYLVARANGDELTGSAALEALCTDPAFTVAPVVRAIVQGEGDLEEAELDLLGALAGVGEEAAELTVAALIDSLPDESAIVEERAVQGLVALRSCSTPALLEALDNHWRRGGAAVALGRCGDGRAVTALIETLSAEDPALRRAAAETLGELGDPRSAEALLAAARDESHEVRAAAVSALNRLGSVAVLAQVAAILRPALEAMGTWVELSGGEGVGRRLELPIDVPLRAEPTGESTQSAGTSSETTHLYSSERPDAAEDDDDAHEAEHLHPSEPPDAAGDDDDAHEAEHLHPIEAPDAAGDQDDAPDLVLLREAPAEDAATVPVAEQSLLSAREQPTTPQGENDHMAVSDDELAVTRLAEALVNAYLVSRANGDQAAGSAALEGLCANPTVTAAPVVRAIVKREGEGPLHEAELELLGSLAGGDEEAAHLTVAALIDSSADESPVAEERAVQGLVALSSESVPVLIEALDDEQRRPRAAVALGRSGDARAVTPLAQLLSTGDPPVRRAAAETLGELGDPRSAEALFAALRDDSHEVQAAAVAALNRFGSARLLVEIVETWRAAIEQAGGRMHLSGPDPTTGGLSLTIGVPVHSGPTDDPTESTGAISNPDRSAFGERPDVGDNDAAAPSPSSEEPPRNTPRFLRAPWHHAHTPNSQ